MSDDACCKSGRIAKEYGLERYLRALGEEWSRPDGRGSRRLTTAFNTRVLQRKISRSRRAYAEPLEEGVEALYRMISEDNSETEHQRAEGCLETYGLDPEQVCKELPSYKTLHRHFRACEGREPSEPLIATDQGPEIAQDRLHGLRERTEHVVSKTLRELAAADHLVSADYTDDDISVTAQLDCPLCGDQHAVERFIQNGCPESLAQPETPVRNNK